MEDNKNIKREKQPRYMGVIRSFNHDRGFGFVQSYDDGQSYFCHISQFVDDVPERGMVVEFGLHTNKEGKQCCSRCLVVETPERRRNRY